MGRRRGRLSGRQFPAAVAEWNGTYRDTVRDFWRGEPASSASSPAASPALGPLPARRPQARARASTSSPRTTASRCAISSPTTTSTTRRTARTTATATDDNRSLELRRRGRHRRPGRASTCARASSATCSRPCSCRRACRCCSAATSSAAPSGATTTRTARTTSISWFDWNAIITICSRSRARSRRCAKAHPIFRRRGWFRGLRSGRRRSAREGTQPDIAWIGEDGNEIEDDPWHADAARSRAAAAQRPRPGQPDIVASRSSTTRS